MPAGARALAGGDGNAGRRRRDGRADGAAIDRRAHLRRLADQRRLRLSAPLRVSVPELDFHRSHLVDADRMSTSTMRRAVVATVDSPLAFNNIPRFR